MLNTDIVNENSREIVKNLGNAEAKIEIIHIIYLLYIFIIDIIYL